jgi:3-hydroxyacyl-CoA dehydrogenase
MAKIAIVGCGFIGRAWAISFARAGHTVALWDAAPDAPEAALRFIDAMLPDLAADDLLGGQSAAEIRQRLRLTPSIEDALSECVHVQENTPEKVEVKREVFSLLDRHAQAGATLASSTSAILPSAFTGHVAGRERCLVVHPINPPYLIPAVEIVPAPWTSPTVIERTRDLLAAAGHAPLVMKRELDGFIMNRLQGALLEEAFRLVADGYASAEDVDTGIRDGLALRWSFMGPFETIDLNAPGGVRDYVSRYQGIYERIHPSQQRRVDWGGAVLTEIERDRRSRVAATELEGRQRWRDRRLMALVAHKRKAARDIGS